MAAAAAPIGLLTVASMSVAGTTNPVPYAESFEAPYTNSQSIVGTNGWSAPKAQDLRISAEVYTNLFFGWLPLESLAHSQILKVATDEARNVIDGGGTSNLWVDVMLKPGRWSAKTPPFVGSDAHTSLAVDSDGNLRVWCRYIENGQPAGPAWLTFDQPPIASNAWIRLTVALRFGADIPGGSYFQLMQNSGDPLTHARGMGEPLGGSSTNHWGVTNGSWFLCTKQTNDNLQSVVFCGDGSVDDLVVTNTAPARPAQYTIAAASDTGGQPAPGGAVTVKPGSDVTLIISEAPGYTITNVAWGVATDSGYLTNPVAYATNSLGKTNRHVFSSVNTNYVLYSFTKKEDRVLTIVNAGPLGTPVPAAGSTTNPYNWEAVCRLSGATELNTHTARNYYAWSLMGGSTGGDSGLCATSVTFNLRGTSVSDVTTLTWNGRRQHWLGTSVSGPPGFLVTNGSVDVESGWFNASNTITIVATPYGGGPGTWGFTNWAGATSGCTLSASNTIDVPMNVPRSNIIANFVYTPLSTNWQLVVSSSAGGSPCGSPTPSGTNTYPDGQALICRVAGSPKPLGTGTQRVCLGWTGLVDSAYTWGRGTNTPPLTLYTNQSLSWIWGTEYQLAMSTTGGAVVAYYDSACSHDDSWWPSGAEVEVSAYASNGWAFQSWSGDVPAASISNSSVVVTMDGPRTVSATFTWTPGTYGVPLSWFDTHGLRTYYSTANAAEAGDDDTDGKVNWEEYVTGTDPTNSNSVFKLLSQEDLGASNYLAWYCTTNTGVTNPQSVYRSTNLLNEPAWSRVADGLQRAASGTNEWYDVSPPTNDIPVFYKVIVIWTN